MPKIIKYLYQRTITYKGKKSQGVVFLVLQRERKAGKADLRQRKISLPPEKGSGAVLGGVGRRRSGGNGKKDFERIRFGIVR